jgi:NADH dehydrogenase/NADH:ubiquinone oxidoreductase subunit G
VTVEQFYGVINFGNTVVSLLNLMEGKSLLCGLLLKANKPAIVLGQAQDHFYYAGITNRLSLLIKEYFNNNIAVLHYVVLGGNDVGMLDMGVTKVKQHRHAFGQRLLYIMGSDEIEIESNAFRTVVYQGHHGDYMFDKANVVFPGMVAMEKECTFVNIEGRAQQSKYVINSSGNIRVDWRILNALAEYAVQRLERRYSNLLNVRSRLHQVTPYILNIPKYFTCYQARIQRELKLGGSVVLQNMASNFYMMDSISRASVIMILMHKKVKTYISNYRWKL